MRLAGTQRWGLADGAGDMRYAALGIGHGEVERTSRYVGVHSVTIIWRRATRSGDVYRSRPAKTADGIMRLADTQRWGLADGAGDMRYAALGIGHGEVERTSRYESGRASSRKWRRATRSGDVYRSSPAKTADGIMRLAGTQLWGLSDGAGHMRYAALVFPYTTLFRSSRYVGVHSVTIIWRRATRSGDVYRSRPAKTADGIMRLAGTQRWGLADGAGDMRYAALGIGHGEVERSEGRRGGHAGTIIWRRATR